ncbi:ATP-binding protein [Sulfurimonas sp.]
MKKIVILLAVAIILFIIPFLIGGKALRLSDKVLHDIESRQLELVEHTSNLENELKKNHIKVLEAIIIGKIDGVLTIHKSFRSLKQKVDDLEKFSLKYNNKQVNTIIDNVKKRMVGYASVEASLISAIASDILEDKEDALIGYNSVSRKFSDDITQLRTFANEHLVNQVRVVKQSNEDATIRIFFSVIFAIIILLYAIYKLYRTKIKFEVELKRANKAEELAKIGSWKLNHKDNNLTWSDGSYKVFGINKSTKNKLNLNECYNLIHPEDIKKVQESYNNHLKDKLSYKITYRINTNSGIKYIDKRYETIFGDDEKPFISQGTFQDVTEQINKDKQLLQQSRMAQMGEMISMIAHQWRQPLNMISISTASIQFDVLFNKTNTDKLNKTLDGIAEYSQHLSDTIDDFRNFYKTDKQIDVELVQKSIARALKIIRDSLLSDKIEITESYKSRSKVSIFSNEILQVILNILKNSQDNFYEKKIKNPKIYISCQDSQDGVTINICDNGGGISENIMSEIFNPYFSTKGEKNGTGLGLYMSKVIIEDHHKGTLEVNNTNDGVCFKIKLLKEITN